MKKYFILILTLILSITVPASAEDFEALKQEVKVSVLAKTTKMKYPLCSVEDIIEHAQKNDIDYIKNNHCLDFPKREEAHTAYYMRVYDILDKLISLPKEDSNGTTKDYKSRKNKFLSSKKSKAFENLVNGLDLNPNIILGANKISLIGGGSIS